MSADKSSGKPADRECERKYEEQTEKAFRAYRNFHA